MEKVNVAVSAETERQNKMGVTSKKCLQPQINPIGNHTDNPEFAQECQSPSTITKIAGNHGKEIKPSKLVAALEAVQLDLASLKKALNKSQTSGKEVGKEDQHKRRNTLCNSCKESGEKCDHCYKCGSREHFARGCKKTQGNDKGLRPSYRV